MNPKIAIGKEVSKFFLSLILCSRLSIPRPIEKKL